MKKIHIFKTGTHTDSNGVSVSFTETDLQNSINAYNPAIHQAPIVIGHPKTDAPAFGWVKSLTADNGNLYAVPEQIQHDFGEQVKQGLYKKVSASFYPPNSPTNPVKGVYYLRHIGFLGAEPPAIKGLEPIEFNENDNAIELTLDFSELNKTADTPEKTLFNKVVSALGSLLFNEQPPSEPTTPPNPKPTSNPQKENAMMTPNPTPPINPAPAPAQATRPLPRLTQKMLKLPIWKPSLPKKSKPKHRQKLKQTNKQTMTLPKALSKMANLCQPIKKWWWQC